MKSLEKSMHTAKTTKWLVLDKLVNARMIFFLILVIASIVYWQIMDGIDLLPTLDFAHYLAYGLIGFYVLIVIIKILRLKRLRIDVFEQRIIVKQRRGTCVNHIVIPLKHVTSYEVSSGGLGCILKYGNITFYSAGGHTFELKNVGRIHRFQESFYAQMLDNWIDDFSA